MRLTKIILLFLNIIKYCNPISEHLTAVLLSDYTKVIFNFPQNAYGYVVTSFSHKTDLKENNRRFLVAAISVKSPNGESPTRDRIHLANIWRHRLKGIGHDPFKVGMWVRFPLPSPSNILYGFVVQ